jgi:ParB family transcriptional regulator, chromosome partitioning protein
MDFEDPIFQELLPLNSIFPAKLQCRTFDSNSKLNEVRDLASSIKTHGLLQPIIVRPAENGFEIVVGHRRYLACKLLRWKKIAVRIKDLSDIEAFEVQIVENVQRSSLNSIEEAQSFNVYVNEFGWGGVTNLAEKINKSEQYVSSRIQLLKLPKDIQDHVKNGSISVSNSLELLSLSEKDRDILVERIINENLSVKQTREIKQKSNSRSVLDVKSNDVTDLNDFMGLSKNFETEINSNDMNSSITDNIDGDYIYLQKLALLKKLKLILKISLSRMDNLIHEYEEINGEIELPGNSDKDFKSQLMEFRIQLHTLLDKDLKWISKLKNS